MLRKNRRHSNSFFVLSAFTVAELLIVMLVTGIVFLMAFEGLSIIRQYSGLIGRKLMEKSTLLCGHQALEVLMQQSDSIRKSDQGVIFYSDVLDSIENYLVIDSANISLCQGTAFNILYPNPVSVDYHFLDDKTDLVDSIFIAVRCGKDTLKFDYGLSILHGNRLNIFTE